MAELFSSVAERVKRFQSFYAGENERPLLGFFMGSEYPVTRYPFARSLPHLTLLKPEDFDVQAFLEDCEDLFAFHEECGGDFIFSASAFWGIPWLEACLGCPIFADHNTGSLFAQPPENFSGAVPAFDPSSPWVRKLNEFLVALAEKSAGRMPLATTRMRGISDMLALLYGGDNFVFQLVDEPEQSARLCGELTDFWISLARFQLERIPIFHGGVGSFYYHLWAPAGTVWLQEDAAALMNPNLFGEFIAPCVERILHEIPHGIAHLHPTGYSPYREFSEMEFLALEMHRDDGASTLEDLLPIHRQIMKTKPLIVWGKLSAGELKKLFSELEHRRLAALTVVDSPRQAHELWNQLMGVWK